MSAKDVDRVAKLYHVLQAIGRARAELDYIHEGLVDLEQHTSALEIEAADAVLVQEALSLHYLREAWKARK